MDFSVTLCKFAFHHIRHSELSFFFENVSIKSDLFIKFYNIILILQYLKLLKLLKSTTAPKFLSLNLQHRHLNAERIFHWSQDQNLLILALGIRM